MYLKLKGVAMTQGQVPRDSHPIPIRAPKHHGRGRWGTEAIIAFPLHAFVTEHQPHTHLVQGVVERWLLVKVLQRTGSFIEDACVNWYQCLQPNIFLKR